MHGDPGFIARNRVVVIFSKTPLLAVGLYRETGFFTKINESGSLGNIGVVAVPGFKTELIDAKKLMIEMKKSGQTI